MTETDIVERLRKAHGRLDRDWGIEAPVLTDAADEINALRARANDALQKKDRIAKAAQRLLSLCERNMQALEGCANTLREVMPAEGEISELDWKARAEEAERWAASLNEHTDVADALIADLEGERKLLRARVAELEGTDAPKETCAALALSQRALLERAQELLTQSKNLLGSVEDKYATSRDRVVGEIFALGADIDESLAFRALSGDAPAQKTEGE